MKKTILTMMFAALFAGGMNAQDANMKRTVLFTLGANEQIYYNEYFASQYLRQNRFVCIVENTKDETLTLVVNGMRMQTVKAVEPDADAGYIYPEYHPIDVLYFDPAKKDSYAYKYKFAGRELLNVGGKLRYNMTEDDDASMKDFENRDNFYWPYRTSWNGYVYDDGVEAVSSDKKHFFLSDYAYEYVVVDGQEVGHSPALNAWYNESNHSFGWSSVEDKELVVYEYKLN
jgi:hypothetical protein